MPLFCLLGDSFLFVFLGVNNLVYLVLGACLALVSPIHCPSIIAWGSRGLRFGVGLFWFDVARWVTVWCRPFRTGVALRLVWFPRVLHFCSLI